MLYSDYALKYLPSWAIPCILVLTRKNALNILCELRANGITSYMNIKNKLSPAVIKTSLQGTTKEEVIRELLEVLVEAQLVTDRETVYEALMERERKMSTGLQHGVAIPHAKTTAVKSLVACIGLKPEGVDFAALDGLPSRIFIMTLSPVDRVGPHVQFLAEVSMVIRTEEARERLLQSKNAQDVLSVFGL